MFKIIVALIVLATLCKDTKVVKRMDAYISGRFAPIEQSPKWPARLFTLVILRHPSIGFLVLFAILVSCGFLYIWLIS